MRSFCLLASIVVLTATSPSGEWRRVNRDEERQSVAYVDMKSIVLVPNKRARGTMLIVLASDNQGMAAMEASAEFDCTTHQRRWLQLKGYDAQSKVLFVNGEEQVWKDTPEGTFYSGSEELICSGGKADIGSSTNDPLPIALGRKYLLDASD